MYYICLLEVAHPYICLDYTGLEGGTSSMYSLGLVQFEFPGAPKGVGGLSYWLALIWGKREKGMGEV